MNLPDDEVRAIAEKYLSERQLLPFDAQFDHVVRDSPGLASAVFANSALGIPGNKGIAPIITVGVDAKGEVKTIDVYWPQLESVGEYRIVLEKEASQRLLSGTWYMSTPGTDYASETFGSVELTWWWKRSDSGAMFIVPSYKFQSASGRVYVPALADEYLGGD